MDGLHSLKLPKTFCNCVRKCDFIIHIKKDHKCSFKYFLLNLSFSEGFDFQTTVVYNGWVMRGENKVSVECLHIFILWDFWFGCKMKEIYTCHGVSRLRKPSFVHVLVAAHNGPTLEWVIRYKMVIGVAQGLQYLHEICHRHIIHGDVKASNILLGPDFEPQVEHKNWKASLSAQLNWT